MIENTSNPESGIDQFLANQVATPVAPLIADLEAKVVQLEQKLANAVSTRDSYGTKIDKITSFIQASIDNGDWTDEELDEIFWEELAEIIDLEIMKTVEVRITAQWTGTLKMKRNQDLSDVEISIDEPEISRYSSGELTDVYEEELTVDER